MFRVRQLVSLFTVRADDPDLALSQYYAIAWQLPLLYSILLLNTAAVAATHFESAPVTMTVFIPALFTILGVSRIVAWLRRCGVPVSAGVALRSLRCTTYVAPLLGLVLVAWALCLYPCWPRATSPSTYRSRSSAASSA